MHSVISVHHRRRSQCGVSVHCAVYTHCSYNSHFLTEQSTWLGDMRQSCLAYALSN